MIAPQHTMSPTERVQAALIGEHVDRVPFCFWHHFKPEGSGIRMAELTMEFFRKKFDLDIVKIMPDLPYPTPEQPITLANQWSGLPRLELDTPMFQQQLICIRTLRDQLGKPTRDRSLNNTTKLCCNHLAPNDLTPGTY